MRGRGTGDGGRVLRVTLLAVALGACRSPEAVRARGGGPGADVGNRGASLEFHAGAEPYHQTPCVTGPVRCSGPSPVFARISAPE